MLIGPKRIKTHGKTPLQGRGGNILCINPSRQLFSSPVASSLLLSLRRHRRHHDLRLADVGKFFRRDRGRSYVTAQHEGRRGQNYPKVVECKHDFKERGGRSKKYQTFSLCTNPGILFMSSKDEWRLRHSAAADAELIAGKIGRTADGRNCRRLE